jgi:hypothetical protein
VWSISPKTQAVARDFPAEALKILVPAPCAQYSIGRAITQNESALMFQLYRKNSRREEEKKVNLGETRIDHRISGEFEI